MSSAPPPNIRFVDDRGFLTREARAYLSRITENPVEQFISGVQLGLSPVSYITLPFNVAGEVTAATAANTSGTDGQVVVYIVPDGEAPAPQWIVVSYQDVPALSSVVLSGLVDQAIPPGASIYALASIASAITLTVSGVRRPQ